MVLLRILCFLVFNIYEEASGVSCSGFSTLKIFLSAEFVFTGFLNIKLYRQCCSGFSKGMSSRIPVLCEI